ncbi:MAG: FtsX-like permease family protein [Candidatus Electrothrix sp. AR1]|nr:FtsX-like permease family protein [Candidatus Electrothrix sp. AR1]
MAMDLPIAWLQLRAQKPQAFWAIASITFITVLLFIQIGTRSAFLDGVFEMPRKLKGDLFMFNASTVTALRPAQFSQRQLYQALAFTEVDSIMPLYMQGTQIPSPTGGPGYLTRVLVIGFPLSRNPFDIRELDNKLHLLGEGGVLLMDERSRPEFKPIIQDIVDQGRREISLRSRSQVMTSVNGLFTLGVNDANYSHLLTSDATFMDIFGTKRKDINMGVIHLKPEADVGRVQKLLSEYLPSDVVVRQKREVLAKEKELFEFKTPVGMVFRFAMVAAVAVGVIVVYQLLFQITSKYLREYSTLKALGYSHGMLVSIVLTQAMTLAVTGYALGFVISFFLYAWLTERVAIPYEMKTLTGLSVFTLIFFISLISALLAIRKLRELDPAELFG